MIIRDAPPKHPDSSKWYWLQWSSDELQGATISNSIWILPGGIVSDQESFSGSLVGIRLSGGTLDQDYDVVNNIATSSNENLRQKVRIRIRDVGH